MAQVRRPLIGLLALFAGAIALDRVGLEAGEDVVATHAYALALACVAAALLLPMARRSARAVFIITAAGIALSWTLLSAPVEGIHVTFVGLAFVALAAGLGHTLAASLTTIDELVATAVAGENPAIDLEGPVAASEIHTEITRSRRHDRPLSITVLAPSSQGLDDALDGASLEIDRSIRTRFLFGSLARSVARQLRRSDLLFEHRRAGRLIVVSPETDDDGSSLLMRRVIDAAARSGIGVAAGKATFPDDGIGFESLLDHAQAQLAEADEPRLRAVGPGGVA